VEGGSCAALHRLSFGLIHAKVAKQLDGTIRSSPMISTILAGLSLIDATGLTILAITISTLLLGMAANLWLRARYAALDRDLRRAGGLEDAFEHEVLRNIVRDAVRAARRPGELNTQAIIEERFQSDLRSLLFAERFVRSATGLVIILGLLGTFYGLTLSIGKIVHLVSGDAGAVADVAQGVSQGLSSALSGMAVAFSNSLVGVFSAVVLTVLGILSNVSDRRMALMVQIETYLDRTVERQSASLGSPALLPGLGDAAARLDGAVARFESALQTFAANTRDFHEFNAHLKDNVQRLSLAFSDLSDTLKTHLGAIRPGPRS